MILGFILTIYFTPRLHHVFWQLVKWCEKLQSLPSTISGVLELWWWVIMRCGWFRGNGILCIFVLLSGGPCLRLRSHFLHNFVHVLCTERWWTVTTFSRWKAFSAGCKLWLLHCFWIIFPNHHTHPIIRCNRAWFMMVIKSRYHKYWTYLFAMFYRTGANYLNSVLTNVLYSLILSTTMGYIRKHELKAPYWLGGLTSVVLDCCKLWCDLAG